MNIPNLRIGRTYKFRLSVFSNQVLGGIGQSSAIIFGGTSYTIPVTITPTVYEGTITPSSNNNLVFTATSGMDVMLSWLTISEEPGSYDIEITENIEVPITYSISDIKDPAKRKATFSRTVTIPGTKDNNKFFNHIFEITQDCSYNPNKKARAIVINDGIEQFRGFVKLDKINRVANGLNNYDLISYDITLLGNIADLFYDIGDMLLTELDFSEYNHTYNRANQFNSWHTTIIRNGINFTNSTNGSALTITSCQNASGRVQINFSSAHGLVAGDWLLIPESCVTSGENFKWYCGENEVYSVPSSTSIVLQKQ
jgi:hypothetical protein